MKKTIFIALLFLGFITSAVAQTDKEFWFVAPEIGSSHADRPITLRISTLNQPSVITIDIPANPSFTPIKISLPANAAKGIDLTPYIKSIESGMSYSGATEVPSPDVVENKGLHIVSSENINVYYEVLGKKPNDKTIFNSDIFTLKGNNALGTKFYTPFQDKLENSNNALSSNVYGISSIDVVATQNNTTITITPTKAIVGHVAGVPFTKILNRGQTYCAQAIGRLGSDHLSGTLVTADKPITVTIKDDGLVQNSAIDLAGDQLVPANIVGKEYIVVKGQVNYRFNGALRTDWGDRAIIVATADKDSVFINGVFTNIVLNAGQTYNHFDTLPSIYVRTSQPSYVFHLSGFGDELGGAILPPIECTGSRLVAFTRDSDEPFYINLLVKKGGESNFQIDVNGVPKTISSGSFTNVPATNTNWLSASIPYLLAEIDSGKNITVTNSTTDFHVAVINGKATSAGCRYGYFSDYGTTNLKLGSDVTICKGQKHTFSIAPVFTGVEWSTGEKNVYSIVVDKAGEYSVLGYSSGCKGLDTAIVKVNTLPEVTSNPRDTSICAKEVDLVIFNSSGKGTDSTFKWHVSVANGPYTPVSNDTTYEGAGTKQLLVKRPPLSFNGNRYKLVNTGACATPAPAESKAATLKVKDCEVWIPDVFTPGTKDDVNDKFVIRGNEPGSTLEIYNRWGNKVFDRGSNPGYLDDWDASNVTEGVYYYIYKKPAKKFEQAGWVQVIK